MLSYYENRSSTDLSDVESVSKSAKLVWKDAGNYIVPFVEAERVDSEKTYPGNSWLIICLLLVDER